MSFSYIVSIESITLTEYRPTVNVGNWEKNHLGILWFNYLLPGSSAQKS